MTKARTLADNYAADISGITAGTGITGGGTSGTVTITNEMATTIDAKGDLVVGTGADTFGRLAVASTAGYVLTVDSAETTGLKWAALPASGKVLQVVYADYGTATTITTTSFADTGLTATITPTLATSKILVLVSQQFYITRNGVDAGHNVKLLRGATGIFTHGGTDGFGSGYNYVLGAGIVALIGSAAFEYLDSPNTTSATTYKTQGRVYRTTDSPQVIYQDTSAKSTITLLEIGA